MQQNYPKDLTDYYRSHPETFELRTEHYFVTYFLSNTYLS